MASDNEASCASDPNFAVICSFLECFGKSCGIIYPDIARLQEMLENTQEVPQQLIDLHIKLLRKTRKTVSPEKWERALVKFCHTYSNQDGWELERFGYKKARIAVKLRLLKVLLETQFDLNQKFKNEVNKLAANELRVEPLGRDKSGLAYWCQFDEECNIRVYREDLDEENWELVAKDREGVANLINTLSNGEIGAIPVNEDSNSLEISEKPIIDTGQISTSPSLQDEAIQENGIHVDGLDEKELEKSGLEDFEDERGDDTNEGDNVEDMEGEDDITNDESSKLNTEEDDSQQTIQNEVSQSSPLVHTSSLVSIPTLKTLNGKVEILTGKEAISSEERVLNSTQETVISSVISDAKSVETNKLEGHAAVSSSKINCEEVMPLKSIETPVITSPLKLINISEMKQAHEEKMVTPIIPVVTALNITKKHEDLTEQIMKPLDKLSAKNNFPFTSTDILTAHSKLSVKPIDQLAANLVRIQSEKLEKPSGAKSLEKIAENLARTGSIVGNVINGDDDRLPQDFCARNQIEKTSIREHRGIDLSTSPRGWESASEQNRPMDFSGIDLSSRKFNKVVDLPSPGYRAQDFQHREMDLSTKKLSKPEVTNLSYDARAVMMRNHAMVADLSKRQMAYPSFDMSSAPYHNAARIPTKEDHRLPNYTILPDPSKIAALRMNATPVKRVLDADEIQQDMSKRMRADIIPIRGSMDKRQIMNSNWRDEVGEDIEEPMMMIHGEGSGSDCDAVNPGLGEAIEEPTMFFYGEGSGKACQTGNPGEDASADNKESNESKNEADSATSSLSPNKNLNDSGLINEVSTGSSVTSKNAIKLNRNFPQSSVSVRSNCQSVGSTQEKSKFKPTLGIQIIPKNSNSPVKRLSRWDVGKPEEKPECDSSIISHEEDISQKKNDTEHRDLTTEIQDVKVEENFIPAEEMEPHLNWTYSSEKRSIEQDIPQNTSQKNQTVPEDSVQCDSSISLCQADTSETLESHTEIACTTNSVSNAGILEHICDSDNLPSQDTSSSERNDNECKPVIASPPRFFFGPNCISYTSRTETVESQSDQTVSTTIQSKPDTLQYECVSSSKLTEDGITPYRSDEFSVTPMNNSTEKVNTCTSENIHPLCKDDTTNTIEKIPKLTNTWKHAMLAKSSTNEPHCNIMELQRNLASESKEEKPCTQDTVHDFISSSENTVDECMKSEEKEMLDTVSHLHSTNNLKKEDTTTKPENEISILPAIQFTGAAESIEDDAIKEHQVKDEKLNLGNGAAETIEIQVPCTEDEIDCKPASGLSDLEKGLNMDSVSVNNTSSSSLSESIQLKTQLENDFNKSDSSNRTEISTNQDIASFAEKEVKVISKMESPVKNYKENDKNDNIPEFHNQEEKLLNSENENVKEECSIGSDTHSKVCDETSENIEVLQQNKISEGFEETVGKTTVGSFIKRCVPDVNVEIIITDNSTVTSSESIEQYNKEALVPTISSSDNVCIENTLNNESVRMQSDSEYSSFKNECPISSLLPETVPDKSNCKPSKSDTIEDTVEINVPNAIDTVKLDRSSCVDHDIGEDMVIDDKLLKSEELPQLVQGKVCFDENLSQNVDKRDVSLELCSSSDETSEFSIVTEEKITEDMNVVDNQQQPDVIVEPTTSQCDKHIDQSSNNNTAQSKDTAVAAHIKENEGKNQDQNSLNCTAEDTKDLQSEGMVEETKAVEQKLNETNINFATLQEPVETKQSLVANYESSDSNDSNYVFDESPMESVESTNNLLSNLDGTMANQEKNKEQTVQKSKVIDEVPSNELHNTIIGNQQMQSNIEEVVHKEGEHKQRDVTNDGISKEQNSAISQWNLGERTIKDAKNIGNSETTSSREVIKVKSIPVAIESDAQSKENINTSLTKVNNLMDEMTKSENHNVIHIAEKKSNTMSEQKHVSSTTDSTYEIEMYKKEKNDFIGNDVMIETSHEKLTEPLKFLEEKLSSLENDVQFDKSEEMEHITNDPSKMESCETKFNTNLHEQCILNKGVTEDDAAIYSVGNTIPLGKCDNTSSGIDKSEIYKNNISTIPENIKSIDLLQYTKLMSEKPDNLSIMDNREKKDQSLPVIGKVMESLPANTTLSLNDDPPIFNVQQQVTLESSTIINDYKKNANKRLSDVSDFQDVPPLKSKPPYVEFTEPILKNLTMSKVQLDETSSSPKELKISTLDIKTNENVLSENAIEQLIKRTEYNPVVNTPNNMLNETEQAHNLKIDEKKENSEIQTVEVKAASIASDDSMDVDNENIFSTAPEDDPLACTDDETLKKLADDPSDISVPKIGLRVKPVSELVYDRWKLDSTESPKLYRKRRNSYHESNSEDMGGKQHDEETIGGKRIKLRAKHMSDKQLRESVEDSHVFGISSEDEAVKCSPEKSEDQDVKDPSDDQNIAHSAAVERKARGRPRGRRRRGYRGSGRLTRPRHSTEFQTNQASEVSPEIHLDEVPSNNDSLHMTPISQKKRKKRKMVLGLEIGRDIVPDAETGIIQDETPVRQSRRIAQLKIKEEADRRRIEEETSNERKEKKDSTEKKKRKKQKPESEEEIVIKDIEKEKKSKKKRRKRKKKKMLAKFNEANPWQSSSGSSSDDENENDEEEEEEEEIESEGSLLFKSDHEFSPESDLEKDQESEPLKRARTAQKAQSEVEEADDEYACQKCSKADHPEWILLCDSCDKGWHCSCLRPALMLIPEGDWFCPPCQHNLLVAKLRESLRTYDQLTKRHENEILRKKRLAFVGISLDNVLHKNESQRHQKGSKASSQESDNESSSASSSTSTDTSSSDESEPVYQLRERRCANRYKFNDYDAMINAAIQDEVEAVQGAGNQGRGKDIATIVNAEKEEAQLHFKNEELDMEETSENKDDIDRKSEKDSDEEYKIEGDDGMDDDEEEHKGAIKKFLSRKKHRKLNSLDISSEDDPESDEDFKGTSSEEEEDFDDHITSSDESTFTDVKRRGKKGDSRSVRRSTRARTTRYDEDFINDDSEESDRPKRKKSKSTWDSDNEDSDNSWRQRKKKTRTISASRYKTLPKTKSRKKKKRKRIIESDNPSENDDSTEEQRLGTPCEMQQQLEKNECVTTDSLDMKLDNINDNNDDKNIEEMKDIKLQEINPDISDVPATFPLEEITQRKKKKENIMKTKKTIRRKIIYGGLPDENKPEEEEILSRRTRGRKINYQEEIASDSEEELKKALRKTGESEDEFIVNEGEELIEDAEKDSDSGDIYNPKKDGHKSKNKSPKSRRPRKSKSPGGKRKMLSDGTQKQRKKPGPKPGSKNRSRKQNFLLGSVIQRRDDPDGDKDIMANVMDNPMGEIDSKLDDNLSENVALTSGAMSVAGSFTGDVPEGSLTGLGAGELAELDDEQLEQMMMEDEEYGRRQLELAAIEIAKKKKKEEREAKKLEKARQKALEILAAERQRDPNALEGPDGEVPKKKKRGRRSKAEILAEQMRRDGAPNLNTTVLSTNVPQNISPNINPNMSAIMTPDAERTGEGHMPLMTGPDGQLFNPDGSPMKPKRRGRGKGKKTLALEAARAAEAAAKAAAEAGLIGVGTDSNSEIKLGEIPNVLPTPGSSTSGSAPSTPPAGVVTTQGPPAPQTPTSQSVYPSLPPNQQSSVITRMLQSQPVSSSPQSFSAAAAAMGHKYFGGPNTGGQMMGGPRTGYEMQPRGRIPSPYRQAGQSSMPPHFAAVRSGTPPMRMRVPGPQMYHTPHHPMDPSPSGGGPISINNRDRNSPLGPGPAMIPPAAGSPLAKGGPTPPPPPPYVRGAPPMSRFTDNPMGPRHQMPPFTNASPVNHNMQQPSPPPNRPPGNFSPYHPPPPPNYHYGAYPPPPPMSTADDAAAYQGSPYPADHFSSPADSQPPIQAPPPPQPPPQQQAHPNDAGAGNKQYDEEGSGEFGGLVSYFSSQREDDLDS